MKKVISAAPLIVEKYLTGFPTVITFKMMLKQSMICSTKVTARNPVSTSLIKKATLAKSKSVINAVAKSCSALYIGHLLIVRRSILNFPLSTSPLS